ncbi:hypothetical protein MNBD_CHLOROFLEXI01-1264, partial [hydrothermal vent metagenome]
MNNIVVERKTSARIPTEMGEFQLCYYKNSIDEKEHLALLFGNVVSNAATLVRV